MIGLQPSLILTMAAIGHGGLHIALYNRINGLGWRRAVVKGIVKVFLFSTFAIPGFIIATEYQSLREIILQNASWGILSQTTIVYGWLCLAVWGVLGVPWILCRPILGLETVHAPRVVSVIDARKESTNELALSSKAKFESRLPWNQLLEISVEQVELPVAGLPAELDGYRIAHLSDIHLTGEIHPDYARLAVQKATQAMPDMMAITGDIIDKQPCIDWLVDIFAGASATDGCYFILGNHDTRIVDSWETRDAMDRAGWIDLGSQVLARTIRGVECELIGNEYPWFARPKLEPTDSRANSSTGPFRILLSHSPDQFGWARSHGIELMLAGHTHGGQGRLPLIGPVLSPSFHGSRYASGDFFRNPTTMHVTRGLGGVHLMRINCRPELSLLTLRTEIPS